MLELEKSIFDFDNKENCLNNSLTIAFLEVLNKFETIVGQQFRREPKAIECITHVMH